MSTSPHKRWKGCRLCKPHKSGHNRAQDQKFSVLRKLGTKRKLTKQKFISET